mgnify:CR=1 FL=1
MGGHVSREYAKAWVLSVIKLTHSSRCLYCTQGRLTRAREGGEREEEIYTGLGMNDALSSGANETVLERAGFTGDWQEGLILGVGLHSLEYLDHSLRAHQVVAAETAAIELLKRRHVDTGACENLVAR